MAAYIEDGGYERSIDIVCDDTSSRRSRASQISARKRRYEHDNGVTLTRVSSRYSETYGFLSRTTVHYRIAG